MNNYNSSNYYRANPYKDIGYMPPIAQKNRQTSGYGTQLPQGRQYFQHATKKHYQIAYKNQIQNDNIMKGVDKFSPIEQQALQRSYFRSLNSKDIQGSSTNTLISKAVKNKQKAQQELQRRKQIQKQQIQAFRLQQQQQQQKRKRFMEQYHRLVNQSRGPQNEIAQQQKKYQYQNSHQNFKKSDVHSNNYNQNLDEAQKKKKRQQQLLRLAQQRKNYALVDFPSLYGKQYGNPQVRNSVVVQSQPNFHQIELERRRKTQRQGQGQGNEKQKINEYIREQNKANIQNNLHNYQQRQQEFKEYDNRNMGYEKNYINSEKSNYNYGRNGNQLAQGQQYKEKGHGYNMIQKDEMSKYQNYSLPSYNVEPVTQIRKQYRQVPEDKLDQQRNRQEYGHNYQMDRYNHRNQHNQKPPMLYNNNNGGDLYQNLNRELAPENQYKVQPFRNREQLRRHNPTYLSYGSPTFTLASKNVIGY